MNIVDKTDEKEDVKINVKMKLSAIWVALMLIYIYADILYLYFRKLRNSSISFKKGV
jgi:hypothetical protein